MQIKEHFVSKLTNEMDYNEDKGLEMIHDVIKTKPIS